MLSAWETSAQAPTPEEARRQVRDEEADGVEASATFEVDHQLQDEPRAKFQAGESSSGPNRSPRQSFLSESSNPAGGLLRPNGAWHEPEPPPHPFVPVPRGSNMGPNRNRKAINILYYLTSPLIARPLRLPPSVC